jgi:type II secretory pathway pseudopilin PulG
MSIPPTPRRDEGFTLLETLVSVAMITLVMAGLTTFFIKSTAATALQSQFQAANQLASAAMEQVTLLPGDALLAGRPVCLVKEQWAPTQSETPALPNGVSTLLSSMAPVGDPSLATFVCPAGSLLSALLTSATQLDKEALPTQQAATTKADGVALRFTEYFYVGLCWQARSTPGTPSPSAQCVRPTLDTIPVTLMPMLRVAIAVTWDSARCPYLAATGRNTCSYVTDTLVNEDLDDLTFS